MTARQLRGLTAMQIFGDLGSGNCLKVRYTADYLGLPYTWVDVDIMAGASRSAEFLAHHPMGQVPAVRFADGRCLSQSNAIIRYLAEGSRLLPGDPFARAKVDELLFWEQHKHEPYIAECRFHVVYLGRSLEQREAWRVARGEQALDFLEAHLGGREWLADPDFSIADIALLAYTRLAAEGGFELDGRPRLREWIGRCEATLGLV